MTHDDYILTRKASGDARTVERIGAEFDALALSLAPPPPDPAVLAAAVVRSDAVNAKLSALAVSDSVRFEALRFAPFEDQAAEFGL